MSAWGGTPVLTGRHVTLRPLERSDRAGLLQAFADGLGGTTVTVLPTPETINGWFDALQEQVAAGRAMPFTVLDAAGRVSGTTRFLRMAPANRRVQVGGTLYGRRVQRTGLNTDAKRLLLGHAFDELGCRCVQLRTNFLNRRSRAAIERLGARLDGVLRGHMVTADGEVRDTAVYSILANEWPQVRRNLTFMLESRS